MLVKDDDDDTMVPMVSLSENLIRASMTSVDIWRGVEDLEKRGWNEQAIADALNLPVRTIKRLKLLAHIHPPMLDVMAQGSMPTEEQLCTIAAATLEEQAQVWKKNKPKRGHDASWHEIARALSKRRIPFSAAKFDDDLAHAYGVVWEDTCCPAGEDGRYTTNVEGSRRAAGMASKRFPNAGACLRRTSTAARSCRRKAEQVYGKPGETSTGLGVLRPVLCHGEDGGLSATSGHEHGQGRQAAWGGGARTAQPKSGRNITQKGNAIIGDLRPTRSTRPCGNAISTMARCWRCSCWPSAARTYDPERRGGRTLQPRGPSTG